MVVVPQPTPALTTFYVYLTSGCNCACRHCWFVPGKSSTGTSTDVLDPDVLRQAITQALPLGLNALKWTGGEPTFHPRFCDFLALQQEFKLDGLMETNGMLIDDPLAEQIKAAGVSSVSVSLDGSCATTHDAIRGVDGGFGRTVKGIAALVRAGYRPELILTLQHDNRDELDEYLHLAQQLGAGNIKLNILQPILRGAELQAEGEHLEIAEILEIDRWLEQQVSKKTNIPVQLDLPMAFRPLSKMLSGEQDGTCNIMRVMGILPNGSYALCGIGQQVSELALGKICDQSLAAIWDNHPVLRKLRSGLPRQLQGVCHRCLMKTACLGSCVAANYHLAGDLLAPYWFCQQAANLGLFPMERLAPEKTKS